MGVRLEPGRKRPLLSSVFTEARGCLALESAIELAFATEDAVDDADGGAQVVAGGVGEAGSCVSVGLAEATCRHGNRVYPVSVPTKPAREAWLC